MPARRTSRRRRAGGGGTSTGSSRPRRARPHLAARSCRSRGRPDRAASAHIAWRFTVHHACSRGKPVVAALPASRRRRASRTRRACRRAACAARRRCRPSGTPTRCRDRAGAARSAKPMSPTSAGMFLPTRVQRSLGPIEPVDAAVVLLPEPIRLRAGACATQCGSWPNAYSLPSGFGGAKSIATPLLSGCQSCAAVGRLERCRRPTSPGRGASGRADRRGSSAACRRRASGPCRCRPTCAARGDR